MTDQVQNPDDHQEPTPQFGSGGNKNTDQESHDSNKPQFTAEEFEKLVSRNAHAQDFIKTLKTETAELREQVQALRSKVEHSRQMDDILEALQQRDENTNMPGQTTPQLDTTELLAQLKADVFNELSTAERQRLEEKNWTETQNLLQQQYGERYAYYVDERAKELDMTNDEMEDLARTKPKVFMELLGSQKKTSTSPTIPSQSSAPMSGAGDAGDYYAKINRLRRDLSTEEGRQAAKVWSDPEFQQKYRMYILEKAQKEGSQFGNYI